MTSLIKFLRSASPVTRSPQFRSCHRIRLAPPAPAKGRAVQGRPAARRRLTAVCAMGFCQHYASDHIAKAFACSIGAGLATLIGTLTLFVAPLRSSRFVAAALGFASGVLLYVSLVDIFATETLGHFTSAGNSNAQATAFATLCFFGGMPIAYGLDLISDLFTPSEIGLHDPVRQVSMSHELHSLHTAHDPSKDGAAPGQAAAQAPAALQDQPAPTASTPSHTRTAEPPAARRDQSLSQPSANGLDLSGFGVPAGSTDMPRRKLLHLGLLAGLVIAVHNLPEGLATFMGYLDSIHSGVTIAVAIAIHNIPEGIIVAIPIYYATHNRSFAILMSGISAITEPIGALVGLAVACTGSINDVALGVVFGLIAGIMVYISLKELLPMARQLDPEDKVSTASLILGMAVMAGSLIAIAYTEPEHIP